MTPDWLSLSTNEIDFSVVGDADGVGVTFGAGGGERLIVLPVGAGREQPPPRGSDQEQEQTEHDQAPTPGLSTLCS